MAPPARHPPEQVASVVLVGDQRPVHPHRDRGTGPRGSEAVYGDPDDLLGRQHELAARPYALLQADNDVQPQDATS